MIFPLPRRRSSTLATVPWKRPLAATLSLLLPTLAVLPSQAQTYANLYDLGTLGGTNSQANAIANNRIVGASQNATGLTRATVWAFSSSSPYAPIPMLLQELPPLAGYSGGIAYGISANMRRIVGNSSGASVYTATGWDWDNTVITGGVTPYRAFNIHPSDGYENSTAYASTSYTYTLTTYPPYQVLGNYYGNIYGGTFSSTSDAAQPFGATWITPPSNSSLYYINSHIFQTTGSDLGRLAYSYVRGAAGRTYPSADTEVGTMWNPLGPPRAFCRYLVALWTSPMHLDINNYWQWDMCAGNVDSGATAITPDSAAGNTNSDLAGMKTVAGWMQTANGVRGFVWKKQGGLQNPLSIPSAGSAPILTTLPTLGGDTYPTAIRNSIGGLTQMVVGRSAIASGSSTYHAFAHYGGSIRDLNNILPVGSGWVLTEANGCLEIVSGTWLIVGTGEHTVSGVTKTRGFMLVITGVPT